MPAAIEMTVNRSAGAGVPRDFDALGLAARGETLAGEVDLGRRPRVADRLVPEAAAPLAWQIAGAHDALGRPTLVVTIEGALPMLCQRCLQLFDVPIAQRSEVLLARDGAELKRLDAEAPEVVLAAAPIDALSLIEDEVLLSLPFAPRHPEGGCPPGATENLGRNPARQTNLSPFASLAALKRGDKRKNEE
jgi:uncharacterized protein